MASRKKYLVVIAGPTAVGKTDLSIELARSFNSVIFSADSRQIYREMSVGTAKPDSIQLSEVKHYFVGSHSVKEDYTVGQYESDALNLLQEVFKSRNIVFLTGGSGLFIKAVCEGFDELPAAEPEVREKLNRVLAEEGLGSLLAELAEKDPEYFSQVDKNNPRRIIRALEVIRTTGSTYSRLRTGKRKRRGFDCIKIMISRDREDLYRRIDLRVDKMLAEGLVEEARTLIPFREMAALQTVGYSEMFDFFDGKYDFPEAVRLVKRNTRRYAKRQLTWFRKEPDFTWFHPDEKEKIRSFLLARMDQAD